MPKIYTLGTKAVMASGYKKGKEEKRRYDQAFAEDVKNNKASRAISAFNANTNARKAWQEGKAAEAESKANLTKGKSVVDSDNDGLGEYTAKDLASSSVASLAKKNTYDSESTKNAYERPTDEQNSEAYKNSLFKKSAGYKFKTNQWRSK
jgi:hypothetical protein